MKKSSVVREGRSCGAAKSPLFLPIRPLSQCASSQGLRNKKSSCFPFARYHCPEPTEQVSTFSQGFPPIALNRPSSHPQRSLRTLPLPPHEANHTATHLNSNVASLSNCPCQKAQNCDAATVLSSLRAIPGRHPHGNARQIIDMEGEAFGISVRV